LRPKKLVGTKKSEPPQNNFEPPKKVNSPKLVAIKKAAWGQKRFEPPKKVNSPKLVATKKAGWGQKKVTPPKKVFTKAGCDQKSWLGPKKSESTTKHFLLDTRTQQKSI